MWIFIMIFRIGAARMWSDNRVIFEPREQCHLHNMRWTDHLLIWSGKGTGEWICHVTDLRTLQDIATFKEDEVKPPISLSSGYGTVSSKYFCACSDMDKHCYIVKDYTNSFYKEFQYNKYDNLSIKAIIKNFLILDCSNWGTGGVPAPDDVVIYNFIDDTSEIIDSFHGNYRLSNVYAIDEKLYFVIQIEKGIREKNGYDIWCYDLKLRKYSWKQYCVFEDLDRFTSWSFGDQILSYDGKAEIFGHHFEQYRRIVFDLNDGTLLSDQKGDCGESGPYKYIQKIDHTIIYMTFGYRNGRDFYINMFTFDSLDDKLNTDRNIEWEHTEQGNEIIEKMGL